MDGEGDGIPQEEKMKAKRVVAFIALIALVGLAMAGDAVAGEKSKGRSIMYTVKWEKLDVPGQEKHLVALSEAKGISSILEGKDAGDVIVLRHVEILDIDLKSGKGSSIGYGEGTDKAGDKYYYRYDGRRIGGPFWAAQWEGELTYLGGTGKYEGVQGKGTFSGYPIAPMQSYSDWEAEMEFWR